MREFQKEEWPRPTTNHTQTVSSPATKATGQIETKASEPHPNNSSKNDVQLPMTNGSDHALTVNKNHEKASELDRDSIIESMIEGDVTLNHDKDSMPALVDDPTASHQDFANNNDEEKKPSRVENEMQQSSNSQLNSTNMNEETTSDYRNMTNGSLDEKLPDDTIGAPERDANKEVDTSAPENIKSTSNGSESDTLSKGDILVHRAIVKTVKAYLAVLANRLKVAKATEQALVGIAMIVEHQYYAGNAGGIDDLSGSGRLSAAKAERDKTKLPPPSLLHRMLQGIASTSESNSEMVQAAVVKTLTTLVSSPKCHVHEGSLLLAMKSTFHVYLVTKSTTCRENAKTALMNMLKAVFMRMETYAIMNVDYPRSRTTSFEIQTRKKSEEFLSIDMNDIELDTVAKKNRIRTTTEESVVTTGSSIGTIPTFASQHHADVFFLFRALCRLSSKELPADDTDESERKTGIFSSSASSTDPTELNSKLLSLELILAAVEVCGEAFTTGDRFLYLVQQYMSGALLKNCLSNQTHVAFLSQKIFLVLVRACINIFFLQF